MIDRGLDRPMNIILSFVWGSQATANAYHLQDKAGIAGFQAFFGNILLATGRPFVSP
jgi:hypothetical protein